MAAKKVESSTQCSNPKGAHGFFECLSGFRARENFLKLSLECGVCYGIELQTRAFQKSIATPSTEESTAPIVVQDVKAAKQSPGVAQAVSHRLVSRTKVALKQSKRYHAGMVGATRYLG
jgi:hypothetical protein